MLRVMTQGVKSPVRKNYGETIHSDSVFFGAGPISSDHNNNQSSNDDQMTPMSMYNTSFNINKELQNIIQTLRSELKEQRNYFDKLNKSHSILQTKYSKDIQSLTKKLHHLSDEKHELTKDLDLALERERNITKQTDDKMDINNDIKTILNNDINQYKQQIADLNSKNDKLIEQQQGITAILQVVNNLETQFKQQCNINTENHEKMKLVFEDTAIQLDKYHQSQAMVESLKVQIELFKHQKSEYFTVLKQWMGNLPKDVCFQDDHNELDLDWNNLRMKLSQITKNIAVVIAEHERIQNELRISLENEKTHMDKHGYPEKLKELQSENDGLKQEIKKSMTEVQLWMGNNQVIEESNLKLIEENKSLNQEINNLNEKCQSLKDELQDVENKCESLQSESSAIEDKYKKSDVERETLNEKITALSMEKQQLQDTHKSELEELTQTNTELTSKMEKLNEELANNKHNIELLLSVTAEKEQLATKNQALKSEIADYVLQLQKECDENENIKKERDEYLNKYNELKSEIEALKIELDNKSETVGVAIIGNTDGMKKSEIMNSFITLQSNSQNDISIISTEPTQKPTFPSLRIETDATPFNAKLMNEKLTQRNDDLIRENNILRKKLNTSQNMNRELKEKFQLNKKNTIVKYEQIAKKVSTMRNIITRKDEENKGLRQELEVSHRQFFKLLHHASSINGNGDSNNPNQKTSNGLNVDLAELSSVEDLEKIRESLKMLETSFKI